MPYAALKWRTAVAIFLNEVIYVRKRLYDV